MNQPKSEAKKMINITSRRGSSAESIGVTIKPADNGEWRVISERMVGIL